MVLIHREEYRALATHQLTHRSRKRPRTGGPRPNRAPPWGRNPQASVVMLCAPGRIRTCDTRFRRAVLYPLSYGGVGLDP